MFAVSSCKDWFQGFSKNFCEASWPYPPEVTAITAVRWWRAFVVTISGPVSFCQLVCLIAVLVPFYLLMYAVYNMFFSFLTYIIYIYMHVCTQDMIIMLVHIWCHVFIFKNFVLGKRILHFFGAFQDSELWTSDSRWAGLRRWHGGRDHRHCHSKCQTFVGWAYHYPRWPLEPTKREGGPLPRGWIPVEPFFFMPV